jgi:glycosyltransferase involved in cell wall biosynthesis
MKITVLVATYRRSSDLARCLEGFKQQTRPPDEIVVVIRDTDTETWSFLKTYSAELLPLRPTTVTVPGVVAAYNCGLDAAQGDVIAMIDDDGVPYPDWLAKIENAFASDPQLGGVGGRDWIHANGKLLDASTQPGASNTVGRITWFGSMIGNHHIGEGQPREADILKGANMSFRRDAVGALRFDQRLRGTGAQVHVEDGFCLRIKAAGWKLVYDPAIAIDHFFGKRFDEDKRQQFNSVAWCNRAHNETLVLLDYFSPFNRFVFLFWGLLIGTREVYGFVQLCRFYPQEQRLALQKWLASMQGRWQALQTYLQSQPQSSTMLANPFTPVP